MYFIRTCMYVCMDIIITWPVVTGDLITKIIELQCCTNSTMDKITWFSSATGNNGVVSTGWLSQCPIITDNAVLFPQCHLRQEHYSNVVISSPYYNTSLHHKLHNYILYHCDIYDIIIYYIIVISLHTISS